MKKSISLLGSTGSIGTQCLSVCRAQGFTVKALVAGSNLKLLERQVRQFAPEMVAIADTTLLSPLKTMLGDLPVKVVAGKEAICEIASEPVDVVVNAITGIAGLRPTLAVLKAGNRLALANKEALVTGGKLVMEAAKTAGVEILPIDSEHSAIWQSLRAGNRRELKSVILTASGGPFFGKTAEDLKNVTREQALAHPNWSMGAKISIDSATLMNKGLEVIEAMWLFGLTAKEIQVVVHRQSVIHSAVEFVDGSVIAQMGNPDMGTAIQYALTYPDRLPLKGESFSLLNYGSLTFESPDYKTFASLGHCIKAANMGGLAPCVVNGANERAVELFLEGKIKFLQIGRLVGEALEGIKIKNEISVEAIFEADRLAREFVDKAL